MSDCRITNHPILGQRSNPADIEFTFNGEVIRGRAGEPIAAALLASGIRMLRQHEESGSPRGIYCAIGHCMECRVQVDGVGLVRSCLTPLQAGMRVTSFGQVPNAITGRS